MQHLSGYATSEIRAKLEKAGMLRWFHWSVVLLSLALTFFAWDFARKQQNARVAIQFNRDADQAVALIIERMAKYEDALWAGVAFLETVDGNIDAQLWQRYAEALRIDQRYRGINGIGVIAELNEGNVNEFVREQQLHRPDFKIHPSRESKEYLPIMAITPLEGNEKAVGLDMGHETNRYTAARRSIATGTAQVTGPIVLVQDQRSTPGFLFFAPFRTNKATMAAESRFDALVYAPFVFDKLMEGVLDKTKRQVGIQISDGSTVLFDELVDGTEDFDANPLMKKQLRIDIYGRIWKFDIWSSKSFRQSIHSNLSASILFGGLLIDGMLMLLFYMISRASRQSLQFADKLTSDLESFGLAARVNKIGVFDFDPVSSELNWNDAMFDIYGLNRADFKKCYEAWAKTVHPDDLAPTAEALRVSLAGGDSFESEFRIIHPDGAIRHLSAKGVIFRDTSGKAIRLLGANTDVTDRTTATEKLAVTQQTQVAILDSVGVSIIATDPKGLILDFNTTAETMLGYDKHEVVKQCTPGLFHDPAEVVARASTLSVELGRDIAPGFEVFVAKAAMGEAEQREWTYIRKDGTTVPVLLTVTAIRNSKNAITGFLGVAADITERKNALIEIEQSIASLARSNEELAQFAYVASHDLQEPLRKVTSFCELLREDCSEQLDEVGLKYMGYIVDGSQRMRTLIQDLLAYSRVDNDMKRVCQVNVYEAVQFAIDNLSEAILETGAKVTCGFLPLANADPQQIAQLFQNLIGNAIKYHGESPPLVHIEGEIVGDQCKFWVDDNGIGIAPEFRQQVFGIFKRLHSKVEYAGTGIGLAICKRIVDRLNGEIWVEESEMGGCRFCFAFNALGDGYSR